MKLERKSDTYLTVGMDNEVFGICVDQVREVLESSKITHLPGTEAHTKGLVNVRGKAVTVVDLGAKLGIYSDLSGNENKIIVLDIDENTFLGALVPCVYEVITIQEDQAEEVPQFGYQIDHHYLEGIAKADDNFVILLNMRKIFEEFLVKELSA